MALTTATRVAVITSRGHSDIAPAAELPAPHERLTLPPTERNRPPGRRPRPQPGRSTSNAVQMVTVTHVRGPQRPSVHAASISPRSPSEDDQ